VDKKIVDLYPVAGVQVEIEGEPKLVVVHLPYLTGFGSPQQREHQDRAYCFMPEQAEALRDALTEALNRLRAH
jgi:BssS protein family